MNNMAQTKKTKGRRKIEIKKIEDRDRRQVTFSKRRKGLFAKASELSIVTGAEVAIFVESPGGHVYAYGHPDVETVMDPYLGSENNLGPETAMHDELKGAQEFLDVFKKLELEKSKVKEEEGNYQPFWWDGDIPTNIKDLEEYIASLEELIKNVDARANEQKP